MCSENGRGHCIKQDLKEMVKEDTRNTGPNVG
jgi:hypothetical protein